MAYWKRHAAFGDVDLGRRGALRVADLWVERPGGRRELTRVRGTRKERAQCCHQSSMSLMEGSRSSRVGATASPRR
jgi:hypothetical protein